MLRLLDLILILCKGLRRLPSSHGFVLTSRD
jgi:hypothetical protein